MSNRHSKLIIYLFFLSLLLSTSLLIYKLMNAKEDEPKIIKAEDAFKKGESLYKILKSEDLSEKEVLLITNKLGEYVEVSNIKPGQTYAIERSTSGVFTSFIFYKNQIERYKIYESTTPFIFEVEVQKDEIKSETFVLEGDIQTSLYTSIVNSEYGSPAMAVEMSEIFAWQIDFFTDPRLGDKFLLLCERFYTENGYSKVGKILAAEYLAKKEKFEAIYFNGVYYDKKGKALRKAFLKSPLNYKRISSYFSLTRMHPILKYRRPHKGIDYAAPKGTPVVSVGDGRVIFRGDNGGYGKQIKVRHNGTYETWYAHLSRFDKKIKKGTKVKQGQIIGYVGSTGMSTGPHLDFRVKKNNRFVNYLRLKFPAAHSVKKKHIDDFNLKVKEYYSILYPVSPEQESLNNV
ncbi:MAG: M23 family metallopeptidase [bacterium]|nr:M23 family metallopeptidase [bacterium]